MLPKRSASLPMLSHVVHHLPTKGGHRTLKRTQGSRPFKRRYLVGLSLGVSSAALVGIAEQLIANQTDKGRDPPFEVHAVHVDADHVAGSPELAALLDCAFDSDNNHDRLCCYQPSWPLTIKTLLPLTPSLSSPPPPSLRAQQTRTPPP